MLKDKKIWLWWALETLGIGIVILIDLLTKKYIYGYCEANGDISLIKGVLCFHSLENTGASFGIFSGKTQILAIISIVASAGIFVFMILSAKNRQPLLRISLVMIIGGAIGNGIDRIALGYVRDFIYFELIDFAVFNIADSALTVGTILLIIYVIFFYKPVEKKEKAK